MGIPNWLLELSVYGGCVIFWPALDKKSETLLLARVLSRLNKGWGFALSISEPFPQDGGSLQ